MLRESARTLIFSRWCANMLAISLLTLELALDSVRVDDDCARRLVNFGHACVALLGLCSILNFQEFTYTIRVRTKPTLFSWPSEGRSRSSYDLRLHGSWRS